MTLHFAYAVPSKGYTGRLRRVVCDKLQQLGLSICPFGYRSKPDTSWWPKQSPYENTKNIFQKLSFAIPTKLYDFREQVACQISSEDIFLGHPFFPCCPGRKGVTELSINQAVRPRIFALISPIHCDIKIGTNHINRDYLNAIDRLLPHSDILFAIMGQYWWDQWPSSPFAHWIPKMVRLDMAIDTVYFPRVKNRFNPPGKRGYLYIGRNDPMKGTDFLSELLLRLGSFRCGWIGSGSDIPGIPRISMPRALTPEFMRRVAEDFDFFITTGIADPNPTTILESMAWGFPVICTPQSGYYACSYRQNVYHDDIPKSLEILKDWQFAEENKLMQIADEASLVVEKEYTWDKFVTTILRRFKE